MDTFVEVSGLYLASGVCGQCQGEVKARMVVRCSERGQLLGSLVRLIHLL